MPKKLIEVNERGRRIGEAHPRAVLTDHEVQLLIDFLSEREALITALEARGWARTAIDRAVALAGLSYRCIAMKFEVHKQTVAKVAQGHRRCQVAARFKPYP